VTDDRLAIVTGTTAGIGLAVATALLTRGWRVLGLARRPSAIAHQRYEHVGVDLAEPAEAAATIERSVGDRLGDRTWRRLGLVNNAASAGLLGPVEQVAPLDFVRMLALNVATPTWLMGVVAAEVASRERRTPAPADVAILSYEPGTVDTAMQQATRAVPREVYPWVGMFHRVAAEGLLVAPELPAAEVADFLEADGHATFTERRFGRRETT
jgi:hypothetical protein